MYMINKEVKQDDTEGGELAIIPLTLLEADLVRILREHDYGEFTVIKQHGQPVRVVVKGSYKLGEERGSIYGVQNNEKLEQLLNGELRQLNKFTPQLNNG